MICWVTIIWTIVICSLLTLLYILFVVDKNLDGPHTPYSMDKVKLKSGDLIGIAYDSMRGNLVRIFTGSGWTHVALIVRDKGEPYVVEMAHYGDDETGLVTTPWKTFYEWNKDRIIGYRPYTGRKFPRKKVVKLLWQYKNAKMDLNVYSWMKTLINWRHRPCTKDYFYCSEFVTLVLQESEVIEKNYSPDSYQPWRLLYGEMKTIPPHSYGDMLLINKPD